MDLERVGTIGARVGFEEGWQRQRGPNTNVQQTLATTLIDRSKIHIAASRIQVPASNQ